RRIMFAGTFALFCPLALAKTEGLALSLVWISIGTFAIQLIGSNIHTVPSQVFDTSSVGSVGGLGGACGSIGGMLLTRVIGYVLDHFRSYERCLDLIGSVYPVMVMISLLVMGKVRKIDRGTPVHETAP
ncbi:MAG TPA: hypothetical protein VN648_03530, partial [Candidatus Methylomirabilis sp.]|nr:hypothetical protein [Candidatus Methylomirabilis sp.]